MKMEELYKLGDKIVIIGYMERRCGEVVRNEYGIKLGQIKHWVQYPLKKQREGIIIGARTLSNGVNSWEEDMGNVFTPQSYFKAYLVAFDLRRKPLFVKLEDILPF